MVEQMKTLLPTVENSQKIIGMPILRQPEVVIEEAKNAAKSLKKVLESKERKVMIKGRRYLEFEDWQLLGGFYGVTAQVANTKMLFDTIKKKKFIGFLARAEAIKNGEVISAAEAECLIYERNWGQKAYKQRFMLRSMAQTRACAKTLRNCLSWIVVLAGKEYATTPAEEMGDIGTEATLPDRIFKTLLRTIKRKKITKTVKKHIKDEYGVDCLRKLTQEEGEELLAWVNKH